MPGLTDLLSRPLFGGGGRDRIEGLQSPLWPWIWGILFAALVISRRPDLATYPQLYAEDGAPFLVDAQTHGAASLLIPYNGYIHLAPRLLALIASWFPLEAAPVVMAWGAALVTGAVAAFILARESSTPLASRAILAGALVAATGLRETLGNAANLQWTLAVLGVVVLAADPPGSKREEWTLAVLFAIACLLGPLGAVLAGLAFWNAWRSPGEWTRTLAILGVAGAAMLVLTLTMAPRPVFHTRDWSWSVAGAIVAKQMTQPLFQPLASWIGALLLVGLAGWGAWRGPRVVRPWLAIGIAAALLGMFRPIRDTRAIEFSYEHGRYFALLSTALFAAVGCGLVEAFRAWGDRLRWAAVVVGGLILFNALRGWVYPPPPNLGHRAQIAAARKADQANIRLRILPPGWTVTLRLR